MAEYRLKFTADGSSASRTINLLEKAISDLTKEFKDAEIGLGNFVKAASNLSGLKSELKNVQREVAGLDQAYRYLNRSMASFRSGMSVNVNDSQIDAARKRLGTLNKSLATLRKATVTPIEIKVRYKQEGRPVSGGAITGRAAGQEALESKSRAELQKLYGLFREANLRVSELSKSLAKSSADEIRNALVPAFSDSGEEAINGLANGLKDPSSKISKAAKRLTEETIQDVKKGFGIASPSRIFKQIAKFAVDGLELGFLSGLKDFKSKSVAEIKKIVALIQLEFAKVQNLSGMGGPSVGGLRQQLVGSRAYTSPIGPLPLGSRQPWAKGTEGQFGYSGYEPRMVSRLRGQQYPAAPGSFLEFSRAASQPFPPSGTPSTFLEFSRRASQIPAGGGGLLPPPPPPAGGGGGRGPSGLTEYNIAFSTNASKATQEINRVYKELTAVVKIGKSVKINLDTSSLSRSIDATFRVLDEEIGSIQSKLSKLQIGGKDFRSVNAALGYREGQREEGN